MYNINFLCFLGETEFDVIPELQQLQQEPEFAVLGGVEEMVHTVRDLMSLSMAATIKLSGTKMTISSLQRMEEENDEVSTCITYICTDTF